MKRFFNDMKKYMYYCRYAAVTNLKAEVANSYLNWIWWILEPLCNMLVYYFVFGNLLGNTRQYYIVFIYSGLLMWNFYNRVVLYSVKAVRSNKGIVTRVYVPKYILLLSNMIELYQNGDILRGIGSINDYAACAGDSQVIVCDSNICDFASLDICLRNHTSALWRFCGRPDTCGDDSDEYDVFPDRHIL